MPPELYSTILKLAFALTLISTTLVIINAVLSAKEMGGTLGQGLKKIAGGTIFHTIIITTYILLEKGNIGILNDDQIKVFFIGAGLLGSSLLIFGYWEVYRIAKKLKLFTV